MKGASQLGKPFLPEVWEAPPLSTAEGMPLRMKMPRHGRLGGPEAIFDLRFIVEEEGSDAPEIGASNHHC